MARNVPTSVLDDDLLRLRLLLVVFLAGLTLLGGYLWRIQVAHSDRYEVDLAKQSIRRIRIPGVRGGMVDRHGLILADNRPSHGVALYLEELRRPGPWRNTIDHVEQVMASLTGIIGRPPEIKREDIWIHIRRRLPLPLLAWRDLDEAALARFVELGGSIPGVELYTQAVRVYPHDALACHAIGYVGRADPPEDEEERFHFYLPEMAGRAGLERTMDHWLRGEAGGRLMRVDVSGYRRHDLGLRPPRRGHDLMLALDADIQRMAEQALDSRPGSVVVLDPKNGDVLALASSPGYDLNRFVPSISSANWRALMEDPDTPLLSRAVAGTYPPGSTFKMITGLAGLINGRSRIEEVHNCPGYFQLGNVTFRCWNRNGHGPVNLQQAIEVSCNVYFFHIGLQTGIDGIYHMASALGLGGRSGIELDGEQPGLLPNAAWKRQVHRDGWRDGDTCNVSIGQGALLVTPLQMAMMTAALANGGTVYQPRLVIGMRPEGSEVFSSEAPVVLNRLAWDRRHIEVTRLGMKDVVMSSRGTARTARIPDVVVAGKTGTAEFGRKEDRKRHAWMVAFAPYDDPKVAIAVLVDEGKSGGETAAPVMRQLLFGIFHPGAADGGAG
ncbi:MAG TPA: penicillin-binding protein 2 [Kiritimatiellia bacterium]|nr:penicillin-binding protein 2 [Kiritimatiellia bacterium]HMO98103.1 penicillin-binding protein 2 [Kiritimatiellia bacterium]HMP96317.1 penicillin-binding protein 2 [Kiritimatiellia bacterium]